MTKNRKSSKTISIVIPAYNEAESLPQLYDSLNDVLRTLQYNAEVIFVDDGSSDTTRETIARLARKDKRVRGVFLSRNFGHQAALFAGMDNARGDAVITMDGDLQHPPTLIPTLIQCWEKGNDVVYTVRRNTPDASMLKVVTARFFYALMSRITNIDIPANAADFRLIARNALLQLRRMNERGVFLRGMVKWMGFQQTAIEFDAGPRFAGVSKYPLRAMLQFALEGMTSFSNTPLYLALYFGFVVSFLSFLYAAYVIYAKFYLGQIVPGWASILTAVLFLGGVQLSTIGMIGVYLAKVFQEVKGRPRYIIRQVVGSR